MDALPPISSSTPSANEPDEAEEGRKDDVKRQERSSAFRKSMQQTQLQQGQVLRDAQAIAPGRGAPGAAKAPVAGNAPATTNAKTDSSAADAPPSAASAEASVAAQSLGEGKAGGAKLPGVQLPGMGAQSATAALRYQPNLANLTPEQLKLLGTPPRGAKGAMGPAGDKLAKITERPDASAGGAEAVPTGLAADLPPDRVVTEQAQARFEAGEKPKEPEVERKRLKDEEEAAAPAGTPSATFLPQQQAPDAAPATRIPLPPEMVQQMVEFAAVHTNQAGNMEFHLGLSQDVLGGLRIKLSSYGGRRMGISVRGGQGGTSLTEADLSDLVESLRSKGIEVVDVTVA